MKKLLYTKKAANDVLPVVLPNVKLRQIDKSILEEAKEIQEYYDKHPNGNIISLKNRGSSRTLLAQILQTKDIEHEEINNVFGIQDTI